VFLESKEGGLFMKQIIVFKIVIKSLLLIMIFILISTLSISPVYAVSTTPERINVNIYNQDANSRGFNWVTNQLVTDGQLQIIKVEGQMTKANVDWSTSVKIDATFNDFFAGHRAWKAHVLDLDYGHTYYYRVGSPTSNVFSPVGEQRITDGSNGLSFIHLTDSQGYSYNDYIPWNNTIRLIDENFPKVDAMLFSGDLTQQNSNPSANINEWGYALDGSKSYFMDHVFSPTSGNHDKADHMFVNHFNVDYPSNQDTISGFYYTYIIGDVQIFTLNTNEELTETSSLSRTQISWLENELQKSTAKWKFILLHKGLVSTGRHQHRPDINRVRDDLFPLISQYEVDLVLQGHEHVYSRSKPYEWGNDGRSINQNAKTVTKIVNNYQYNYFLEPGTMYVTPNTASAHPSNIAPATHESDLMPYIKVDVSPVNGLVMNQQPTLPMFGYITVKNDELLYQSYIIDYDNQIVLYDYFGIVKNTSTKIESMINQLPETFSANIRNDVAEAIVAYQGLKVSEKEKVSSEHVDKLNRLGQYISSMDYEQSRLMVQTINRMGNVQLTPNYKLRLDQANITYQGLSNLAKSYVENYQKLVEMNQIYQDMVLAKEVEDIINNIGAVQQSNDPNLLTARNSYNSLTLSQKAYVENYFILAIKEAEVGIFNGQS